MTMPILYVVSEGRPVSLAWRSDSDDSAHIRYDVKARRKPLPPGCGAYPMTDTSSPKRENKPMDGTIRKIVARPMVARACGHLQEFQHYTVDKFRAQRLAKFQKTRCAECVAKLTEEERRAAEAVPKERRGAAEPAAGTQVSLTRQPDGS